MVVVLAAAAIFAYERQRAAFDDAIDHSIASRADDVATLVRPDGRGLAATPRGGRLSESEEGFVQVLTPSGRLIDGTSPVRRAALRPDEARRAARSPTEIQRVVPGIEGRARMLARPVPVDGGTLVVVAGSSLHDRDDALAGLLRSFLIGGATAVLLASAIGYALAAVGLAPVEAMRRRARQISLGRGAERLPLPEAHDEIRRLGETLNQMLARLEASFERERRFLADASHELRTPLAVVKAELEAAMRNGDGATVRESLHSALEETDHLAHLAEDLLLIARADDGRLPVRPEQIPIRELLERTRDRFADRAGEQGRAIEVDVAGDLRAPIDPLRGRQALGNLVDNALRHGVGAIGLSAHRDGDAVEIDVSDEGPGFSRELAPRAFERFARRDGAARERPAAGLGLAIVRAIAEAHGGTATIVSAPSEGATVRLRMPLAEAR